MTTTLEDIGAAAGGARLAGAHGLALRLGPFVARIATRLPAVARSTLDLYAGHELAADDAFVDFDVSVRRGAGWRRFWHSQVRFEVDGDTPFNPLPGDQGFPLLEWGLNWCVYSSCHQYLIIHAAVLERHGCALLLPAPSGSGKSTLCAALLFNGWRLLSDELALIDPVDGALVPLPRPVSLKNESIAVVERIAPRLRFGSRVEETSKGVVAHFAPPRDAVRAAARHAPPGWVVLPRYRAGAPATLSRIERARAFMSLVENSFNYEIFGAEGFGLLAGVIERCATYEFEYDSVDEAIALFARLADGQDVAAARDVG